MSALTVSESSEPTIYIPTGNAPNKTTYFDMNIIAGTQKAQNQAGLVKYIKHIGIGN
jgi:hypothetical protein